MTSVATPASSSSPGQSDRLGRLGRFPARRRWPVIAVWLVLTLFGAFAAGQLSSRWYQSLAVPGKPAYETGQRALKELGAGVRPPSVVVFHSTSGDVTKIPAVRAAMARAAKANPGALTSSTFSTGSSAYVSADRRATFQEIYPPGPLRLDVKSGAERTRAAAAAGLPAGVTVEV